MGSARPGTLARPPSSWWSPRRCSTSRRPASCPRRRSRTKRISPCWRPGTSSSPGFSRTAPTNRRPATVSSEHVEAPRVSVREQAVIMRERLARSGRSTFRGLTQDCQHTTELVARFLALLELYREGVVAFDQVAPLGELWVRWTGGDRDTEPADAENVDEEYG